MGILLWILKICGTGALLSYGAYTIYLVYLLVNEIMNIEDENFNVE